MAEISKCICGAEPVVVRSAGRWIIACPNKECDVNICSYPAKDTAVKNWNKEVERLGNLRKRN